MGLTHNETRLFPLLVGLGPVRFERASPQSRSVTPEFGRALAPVVVACPDNSSGH